MLLLRIAPEPWITLARRKTDGSRENGPRSLPQGRAWRRNGLMIHNAPLRKRPYLRVGAIHQKQQQTMLARQEGAPAQMALCESVGRKAAGGGDESAARVDAMNEQPVKQRNFVSDSPWRMSRAELEQNYKGEK